MFIFMATTNVNFHDRDLVISKQHRHIIVACLKTETLLSLLFCCTQMVIKKIKLLEESYYYVVYYWFVFNFLLFLTVYVNFLSFI